MKQKRKSENAGARKNEKALERLKKSKTTGNSLLNKNVLELLIIGRTALVKHFNNAEQRKQSR